MTNRHINIGVQIGVQLKSLMKKHGVTPEAMGYLENTLQNKIAGRRSWKNNDFDKIINYFRAEKNIDIELKLHVDGTDRNTEGETLTMDDMRFYIEELKKTIVERNKTIEKLEAQLTPGFGEVIKNP